MPSTGREMTYMPTAVTLEGTRSQDGRTTQQDQQQLAKTIDFLLGCKPTAADGEQAAAASSAQPNGCTLYSQGADAKARRVWCFMPCMMPATDCNTGRGLLQEGAPQPTRLAYGLSDHQRAVQSSADCNGTPALLCSPKAQEDIQTEGMKRNVPPTTSPRCKVPNTAQHACTMLPACAC